MQSLTKFDFIPVQQKRRHLVVITARHRLQHHHHDFGIDINLASRRTFDWRGNGYFHPRWRFPIALGNSLWRGARVQPARGVEVRHTREHICYVLLVAVVYSFISICSLHSYFHYFFRHDHTNFCVALLI